MAAHDEQSKDLLVIFTSATFGLYAEVGTGCFGNNRHSTQKVNRGNERIDRTGHCTARQATVFCRTQSNRERRVWLDAESNDQARDIAAQWRPDRFGCHEVTEYFADSTADGAYVPLEKPVDLDWEVEDTVVEDLTVEAVGEETTVETE